MSSYVIIELDRTPPAIEINAPKYSTTVSYNIITIDCSESIGSQEIYVIDSLGVRHDYIFEVEGNKLIGNIRFINFPIGIVELYAKITDDVGNISNLISTAINVMEPSPLEMDLFESISNLDENNFTQELAINDSVSLINILEKTQDSLIEETIMQIDENEAMI